MVHYSLTSSIGIDDRWHKQMNEFSISDLTIL